MSSSLEPALVALLQERRFAVLTGAGCSTESGIPDYRGPETRRRTRNPIRFQQFVTDPTWRHRYWARSYVGWRRIAAAQPNPAHHALAELERRGHLTGLITQNVDGLHRAAGSRDLVALHGRLADVVCLECGRHEDRDALQWRLQRLNPGWDSVVEAHAPDGDADVSAAGFVAADCAICGGPLKPDVVFFGENVPRDRVDRSKEMVDAAEALLVVGSSLTVFSGFRFVKQAVARQIPVAIVNLGESRGDPLAASCVQGRAGDILPALLSAISATPRIR